MDRKQCKAARALLGITQQNLAEISGVGLRSIVSFEHGNRTLINQNARAVREALERAGIEFLGETGVRLA